MRRYDPLSWEYPSWAAINGPAVNILKGAIAVSDRVLTVSQVSRNQQSSLPLLPSSLDRLASDRGILIESLYTSS